MSQEESEAEPSEESDMPLEGINPNLNTERVFRSQDGSLSTTATEQQNIPPDFNSWDDSLSGQEGESSDDQFSDSDTEGNTIRRFRSKDPRNQQYGDLTDTQSACLNFVMEHRIFLKAILALLAERDSKATEIGMNDPNLIKSGPLKKASHLVSGVWKVKFVEVRRGMLSYYEDEVCKDNKTVGALLRKNIPLDSECTCRAVKIHRNGLNMAPGGAIMELKAGSTRRLWLAKSRAERQAWIDAINDAMVGGSVTQGTVKEKHGKSGTVKKNSPFKSDLRKYLKAQSVLKAAKSKEEYVPGLLELLDNPLDVPVQWIMEQVDNPPRSSGGAFYEGEVSSGVDQLWRDLSRDSIVINADLFHGDNGHGTEKIIGALARNIVSVSRAANPGSTSTKYAIAECNAVAYARDILLSINRTRSGGDSYFCIDTLCSNSDLVVTTPTAKAPEPLSISVEMVNENDDTNDYSFNDKTGWIRTKNRLQMSWRKRFFVLSEGTLSLYRNATPRPHGLRGQMVVTDATISVDRSKDKPGIFTISIVTKDGLKDRFLYFNNEDKMLGWLFALECAAKGSSLASKGVLGLRTVPKDHVKSSEGYAALEQSMKTHIERLGLASEGMDDRLGRLSAKTSSQVKISAEAMSEYKVCTLDPQGDETDTWCVLSATFMQTFRASGDRIVRGEEIVRVHVTECPGLEGGSSAFEELASQPRRMIGRRRRASTAN